MTQNPMKVSEAMELLGTIDEYDEREPLSYLDIEAIQTLLASHEALRLAADALTEEVERLRAALELFANIDRTTNSDLWAINSDYCDIARAALKGKDE